jgi:hypothetical protein
MLRVSCSFYINFKKFQISLYLIFKLESSDVCMSARLSKLDSILVSWGPHNHMTSHVRASKLQGMDLLLSSETGPL